MRLGWCCGNGSGVGAFLDALGVDSPQMLITFLGCRPRICAMSRFGFPLDNHDSTFAFTGGQSEFAAEFSGKFVLVSFARRKQELVRAKFTHVCSRSCSSLEGRHGCGFRSGFALEPAQATAAWDPDTSSSSVPVRDYPQQFLAWGRRRPHDLPCRLTARGTAQHVERRSALVSLALAR